MTEKEKRDNQELYDGNYNEEMMKEREKAKDLCFEYNLIKPSNRKEREQLIKKIFAKTEENILVESSFQCDYV